MTDLVTDLVPDLITDFGAEAEMAAGRWEPCLSFAPEVPDSQVCGDCGWLHDDHRADAVVHTLPVRAPKAVQPRRLAS